MAGHVSGVAMLIDSHLTQTIAKRIVEEYEAERQGRVPSGKLSASMLAWPAQWQVLKAIGVPEKPLDEYVIRTFKRGRQVEEWVKTQLEGLVEEEKLAEYRGAVGYIDALVDTSNWGYKIGVVPHEVKSKKNSKFKRLEIQGKPDHHDDLQACFYALAEGTSHYAIHYVAADDFRVLSFILETKELKPEIDSIIDDFTAFTDSGTLPVFVARVKWQANEQYNRYPGWETLTSEEAEAKLKQHFPTQYMRLKNYRTYVNKLDKEREQRHAEKANI